MSGWTAGTIGLAAPSDTVGRHPVFAAGAVVAGERSFVVFPLADTRGLSLLTLGRQLANAVGDGWAPLITVALLNVEGRTIPVSTYVSAVAVLVLKPPALLGPTKESS
ncbi:hypothetical protein DKG34_38515 [Streptomyces sp. NWU49]|uniref:hypothetical protein n=1 Tax=Streptomyces sp. NWU49 TaxID=2201153 RepID=UPI000D67AC72|nr:hypothetical protein [Streptomyces sp. NWU49]PWJ02445.1 hypothetical protein DKG34_38515 [Streptomyces sp. NWU49]